MTDTSETLYERLGGQPGLAKFVSGLYRRILADPLLAGDFAGVDMERQQQIMVVFLGAATGGPFVYNGKGLRKAHASLGLTDVKFNAVLGHAGAELTELGVHEDDIAAVADFVAGTRPEVVTA